MLKEERDTINFLGVSVDVLDTQGLCDTVVDFALKGISRKVMYVNTDCMLLSLGNKVYQDILNQADLIYADGVGVVLGARLWGYRLPGRSTGADFMPDFCEVFAQKGLRLYLLGAKHGVADEAASRLIQRVPALNIVGTHHGYFNQAENEHLIEQIHAVQPHILLVGIGAPKQEIWIHENITKLQVPVVWGVGGLFDFISGRTKRGPKWLLDNGFEWLCRLVVEPRRLWRRYLIGNIKFICYLLWYRLTTHQGRIM